VAGALSYPGMGERPASCESFAIVLSRGSLCNHRVEMIAQDLEGRARGANLLSKVVMASRRPLPHHPQNG
jgi:hypothetical protein